MTWELTKDDGSGMLVVRLRDEVDGVEMETFVAAYDRAVDEFDGDPFRVFFDLRGLQLLSPPCAEMLRVAKARCAAKPGYDRSAILVDSAVNHLQHRRLSAAAGLNGSEVVSVAMTVCRGHLRLEESPPPQSDHLQSPAPTPAVPDGREDESFTSSARVRGVGLITAFQWVQKQVTPAVWAEVVARTAPRSRKFLDQLRPLEWYPVGVGGDVYEAWRLVSFPEDRAGHRAALRELGRFVAEDNLQTLFRVTTANLDPDELLAELPQLWQRYYEGATFRVEDTNEPSSGRCLVEGIGGAKYFEVVVCAWLERAFQWCGAAQAKVAVRDRVPGEIASDRLVLDVRWLQWHDPDA